MSAPRRSSAAKPTLSRKESHFLFNQMPIPAWLVRLSDMQIEEVNTAASERFGYSRQQYLGMKLSDFHAETYIQRLREAAASQDAAAGDLQGCKTRAAAGEIIDTDCTVRFVDWKGGPAAIICALDMSARKQLEERLRQAGKMEAIGMLAGGIAHDFNNLLTIISGYSQLLLNSVPERERTSVEQVLKASERAAELTGQLLAFSRRQDMQPQLLDVNHIVSGMSTMLRRLIGEHIELRLVLAPGLGAVYADTSQIDQVVMNLVVNARDAMAQGGTLQIETRNADFDEELAHDHLKIRAGRYVMLTVTDTGVGMDKKTAARVFDPFFTTKQKGRGTGLGLSTVFGIVKQAGGSVDLYSEPDRGTAVKVYLPRVGDATGVIPAERPIPEGPGGRETILVVEDEEAVRRLVRATLERRGYRVLVAPGGPEAIQIADGFDGPIDLLLTDLVMPLMSGSEVAARIAAMRPAIRVLFMSGYTDRSLQKTKTVSSAAEFLQKPFTPIVLARRVRKIFDQNGTSKAHTSIP